MKVTTIEKLIANIYTPFEKLHLTGDCNENRAKGLRELANEKAKAYQDLVRVCENHGGIPEQIYNQYKKTPCGRVMLRTYGLRCFLTKKSDPVLYSQPSNPSNP
jgi:hypothetical protein